MATHAAYRAFTNPDVFSRDLTREARIDLYAQAWGYQNNTMFSTRNGVNWTKYLAARQMYKLTRLMYNPIPMINGFYIDNLWRPVPNEKFEALATPLSPETDETIVAAVAQIDQWSNWRSDAQKIKKYAVATGNVLVEGVDDLERQKIYHKAVWPGYVTEILLSPTGDVLAYTVEYSLYDPERKSSWTYKKVVTKDSFSYFRDDKPYVPEGRRSTVERNPYGFVFAVWIKHIDDGTDNGSPAFSHWDKVDEANSLGSHLHDNIHKTIESPKLIAANGKILPIIGAMRNPETGVITPGSDPRLDWIVLQAEQGASVHDLAGSLALDEANPYLTDLLKSFTDDYPELQANSIIKDHAQLSGAALERMLGPAQNRLDGVQPNYNQQLIKLRQMGLAVGGMRANNGDWKMDDQKAVFKPFNLNSYADGKLNFNLVATVLVQQSDSENEDVLTKKAARASTLDGIVDSEEQLKIAGYSDEQIKEIQDRLAKENELVTEPDEDEDDSANPGEDPDDGNQE